MRVIEEKRELHIKDNYDVIVIGGGVAGVAAAVSAARQKKRVCLIEREFALGGLATLGIVAIYLPLCDGRGHQLIGGLAEELMKKSIQYGTGEIPDCWKPEGDVEERKKTRYKLRFDPTSFAYGLDEIVLENEIDLMFGTSFSDCIMEDKSIKYAILENREGRFALGAEVFIDASGEAILAHAAKEETFEYKENRRTGWYYSYDGSEYKLNIVNDNLRAEIKDKNYAYSGIDTKEVTRFCIDSRKMVFESAASFRKERVVTQVATIPQFRMTRRIKGLFDFKEADERVEFNDTVGCFGDWRKAGPMFYLPYSSLVGKTKNLLVAGRCISADEGGWDITRAIPVCVLTGEVAGVAAAKKIENAIEHIKDIDIEQLRVELQNNNNILGEDN